MKTLAICMIFLSMSFAAFADNLCVGDAGVFVNARTHYEITVEALYENGTADISFLDGAYRDQNVPVNQVFKSVDSFNGFKVGGKAVFTNGSSHYQVVIESLFTDGSANIIFHDSYRPQIVSLDMLSRAITCLGSGCNN